MVLQVLLGTCLADDSVRGVGRGLYGLFDSGLAAFAAPLGLAGMASGEVVVWGIGGGAW